jgi:hypothetical protein
VAPRGAVDARSITRRPALRKYTFGRYDRDMRVGRLVLGILLILGGLVWVAQGLNLPFAPRSFMTADRAWVVIGAVTALAGAIVLGRSRARAG